MIESEYRKLLVFIVYIIFHFYSSILFLMQQYKLKMFKKNHNNYFNIFNKLDFIFYS